MHGAEVAANKYIQERFVPKLVSAGIVVAVDIVRRPDDESPQGAAIVKKADEIDAACIILCPHEQDFGSEVSIPGAPSFLSARTLLWFKRLPKAELGWTRCCCRSLCFHQSQPPLCRAVKTCPECC